MRMDGTLITSYPSVAFHAVALTIDAPPLVAKGPRLNRFSIGLTPDWPRVPLQKVEVCRSHHFHCAGSLPSRSSNSATPSMNDFFKISSRVSIKSVVDLSSHHALSDVIWRITSNQRLPPLVQ